MKEVVGQAALRLEHPQGQDDRGRRRGRVGGDRPQRFTSRRIALLQQQAVGRVAVPAVAIADRRAELGNGGALQVDAAAALQVLGPGVVADDPPDPPHRLAPLEVGALADLDGEIVGVLDRLAVHVADVEGAVGPRGEEDGTHPVVGAGQELDAGDRRTGPEGRPGRLEPVEVDQVPRRIAREDAATVSVGQAVAAKHRDRAGGGEGPRVRVGGRDVPADGVEPRRRPVSLERLRGHLGRAVLHGLREPQMRVAPERGRGNHHVLHLDPVVADEPMPEVVEAQSILGPPVGGLEGARPSGRNRKSVRPSVTAGCSGWPGAVTEPPVRPLVR